MSDSNNTIDANKALVLYLKNNCHGFSLLLLKRTLNEAIKFKDIGKFKVVLNVFGNIGVASIANMFGVTYETVVGWGCFHSSAISNRFAWRVAKHILIAIEEASVY